MKYTIGHIASIVGGRHLGNNAEAWFSHVQTDSRHIVAPQTAFFVALSGQRFDAHDFISSVIHQGVRCMMVHDSYVPGNGNEGVQYILVDDTLKALQALARYHREQHDLRVVGITGSNGKTIVKEWLAQLLARRERIIKSPRSYNSQIGVPLSVMGIEAHHTLGIFEAGISQPGEMAALRGIIQCQIGILTNIGDAHDAGFSSRANKLEEKIQLFGSADVLIYCVEDIAYAKGIPPAPSSTDVRSWSKTGLDAQIQVHFESSTVGRTLIRLRFERNEEVYDVPFSDRASLHNCVHCLLAARHLGSPSNELSQAVRGLRSIPMRLEMRAGIQQCILINDSYNADLHSLENALHFAQQQASDSRIVMFVSELLESRLETTTLHKRMGELIGTYPLDHVIGIGHQMHGLSEHLADSSVAFTHFPSVDACLAGFPWHALRNQAVLIKGARTFGMERIFERLSEKIHSTKLEIDLAALSHNLRVYGRFLHPTTKVLAVLKASAYGSGSIELARFLERQRIDYLAVAYADEGIELRRAGVQLPILVLNPDEYSFAHLSAYRLEPEIYALEQLDALLPYLKNETDTLPIHLKLETGMHRLGIDEAALPLLIERLQISNAVRVTSVMTHLASSDDPNADAFSVAQIRQFVRMSDIISRALNIRPIRHVLNSSGILRFQEHRFDMVRLGIGMYGIDTSHRISEELEKVHTLKARIAQVRWIESGDAVGYNNRFRAQRRSRIATLSIGYADGFMRAAGNGRYRVRIHGQMAPIVGQISMDSCAVDVTDIAGIDVGDEAVLFGKDTPIETLAEACQTISYEVLSRISPRVKRIYVGE